MIAAGCTQGIQETLRTGDAVHVAGNRLDDHRGDLLADFGKHVGYLVAVVICQCDGVFCRIPGHTR